MVLTDKSETLGCCSSLELWQNKSEAIPANRRRVCSNPRVIWSAMGEAAWVFCLSHYLISTESDHHASRTTSRVQRCQHIMQTPADEQTRCIDQSLSSSHLAIRIGPARRRELLDTGRMIRMVTEIGKNVSGEIGSTVREADHI